MLCQAVVCCFMGCCDMTDWCVLRESCCAVMGDVYCVRIAVLCCAVAYDVTELCVLCQEYYVLLVPVCCVKAFCVAGGCCVLR